MRGAKKTGGWCATAVAAAVLAGCGGGGVTTVGGTVSGLASGTAVTVQINGGETRVLGANGAFEFDEELAAGERYDVTITGQPARASCTISNGSGRIDDDASRVGNVAVVCTQRHSVGGVVNGLAAGVSVTLRNNGGDVVTVATSGPFTFPATLLEGATFEVTVFQQPLGQTCTLQSASGTVQTSDVTGVVVSCT